MSAPAVLDASALLAVLGDEPRGEEVVPLLAGAIVSTVNWAEVLGRYAALGRERAESTESAISSGSSPTLVPTRAR